MNSSSHANNKRFEGKEKQILYTNSSNNILSIYDYESYVHNELANPG